MENFPLKTKIYLISLMLSGLILMIWNLQFLQRENLWLLLILLLLGSLAGIFPIVGATTRSHYTISFIVYSFALFALGVSEAILVIVVSYLAEWLYRKGKWYISAFNVGCCIVCIQAASLVFNWVNPSGEMQTWQSLVAIVLSMVTFTLLNHLMVGVIVWLARGENFKQSGVFDLYPLIMDLTMLLMGAGLVLLFNYNPFAVPILLLPVYLIYSSLRVPALERQTEIDPKTGLFNHHYFMQQLTSELNRANRFDRPMSIIMADLDLLRNINNTYGHLAGDEVLIGLAKILQSSVREYDVVSRFGGEEFALMLPETSPEQAYLRAEAIRKLVEKAEFTVPTSVTPIHVTLSLGISCRERFDQSGEEIIHNADVALYHAKLKGRNRAFIYSSSSFFQSGEKGEIGEAQVDQPVSAEPENPQTTYAAAYSTYQAAKPASAIPKEAPVTDKKVKDEIPEQEGPAAASLQKAPARAQNRSALRINLFIGIVASLTAILFFLVYEPLPTDNWWGVALFTLLVVLTEGLSVDLHVRDIAISTSAAPLLAGVLLFGPVGALVMSIAFALTAYFKFRGPFSRVIFNASNQLFAALIYLGLLDLAGQVFLQWPDIFRLLFSLLAILIVFLVTTLMISIGMSLNSGDSVQKTWVENFSWLAPHYVVMGMIAFALIFGYSYAGIMGIVSVITPLLLLRLSQQQYLDRTREMVKELRLKNLELEKSSDEINQINQGLLETLAEVIDLRDPYLLGHSTQVTSYAILISQEMGLNTRQIDTIHKACLLHDLGKLGIPDRILVKPDRLTEEEYEVMKRHASLGAALLEKSPSLRHLIPVVKHHHEHFDGSGYPEGLRGTQIPIEARIVAVADAIEAMASDRPYRKAMAKEAIIAELEHYAGTQFDTRIVEIAVQILNSNKIILTPVVTKISRVLEGWNAP
jgi:diguanylate cyclase (GGDEF)-like protein/putative nucleotidyltransferase with HDIG domain